MMDKLFKLVINFFKRIPKLTPLKEGNIILKIGNHFYDLQYKNKNILIEPIDCLEGDENCILLFSENGFKKIFSSQNLEEFQKNLLDSVLVKKELKIKTDDGIDPMKNAFFKLLSIDRGKMGINRYELMVPKM